MHAVGNLGDDTIGRTLAAFVLGGLLRLSHENGLDGSRDGVEKSEHR